MLLLEGEFNRIDNKNEKNSDIKKAFQKLRTQKSTLKKEEKCSYIPKEVNNTKETKEKTNAVDLNNQQSNRLKNIIRELDADYRLLQSDKKSGRIFKSKDRHYTEHFDEVRRSVLARDNKELFDLEETSSLAKVTSLVEHELQINHLKGVPVNAAQWVATVFGAYFAAAGIYFGFTNMRECNEKLKHTTQKIKEMDEFLKGEDSINITMVEKNNIKAHKNSLQQNFLNDKFGKWTEGATSLSASSLMFASLIYPPLTIPSLGLMLSSSVSHIYKNVNDLKHIRKVDINRLKKTDNTFAKEGLGVFTKNLREKRAFHKGSIASWGANAVGISALAVGAVAGIFTGTLPIALIAVGAGVLLLSIFSLLFHNNRFSKAFLSDSRGKIRTEFLGDEESILSRLNSTEKQNKALKNFGDKVYNNFKGEVGSQKIKMGLKKALFHTLQIVTLGIPKRVHRINKSVQSDYLKYLESPEIANKTREARVDFYIESLKSYVEYLENLYKNTSKIDVSMIKKYLYPESKANYSQIATLREDFGVLLRREIRNINKRIDRYNESKENKDIANDFVNTWEYLNTSATIHMVFAKVFDKVELKDNLKRFVDAGFIDVNEISNNGNKVESSSSEKEFVFHKRVFIEKLRDNDVDAKKLNSIIINAVNELLIYRFPKEIQHQKAEICDHLEHLFRVKKDKGSLRM